MKATRRQEIESGKPADWFCLCVLCVASLAIAGPSWASPPAPALVKLPPAKALHRGRRDAPFELTRVVRVCTSEPACVETFGALLGACLQYSTDVYVPSAALGKAIERALKERCPTCNIYVAKDAPQFVVRVTDAGSQYADLLVDRNGAFVRLSTGRIASQHCDDGTPPPPRRPQAPESGLGVSGRKQSNEAGVR